MRRDAEMSEGGGTRRRRQTLEADIVCLEALGEAGLKEAWAKAHGGPAPTALPVRLLRLVPVISRAIADSERQRRPSHSNEPSAITSTRQVRPSQSRRSVAPGLILIGTGRAVSD